MRTETQKKADAANKKKAYGDTHGPEYKPHQVVEGFQRSARVDLSGLSEAEKKAHKAAIAKKTRAKMRAAKMNSSTKPLQKTNGNKMPGSACSTGKSATSGADIDSGRRRVGVGGTSSTSSTSMVARTRTPRPQRTHTAAALVPLSSLSYKTLADYHSDWMKVFPGPTSPIGWCRRFRWEDRSNLGTGEYLSSGGDRL